MYHEHPEHQAAELVATEVFNLKEQKASEGHEEKDAIEVEQIKSVTKANKKVDGHEDDEQQALTDRGETAQKLRRAKEKEN